MGSEPTEVEQKAIKRLKEFTEKLEQPLDLDALASIVGKRTPGEATIDHHFVNEDSDVMISDLKFGNESLCNVGEMKTRDGQAIVAAVNAIGPLIERCKRAEEILAVACSGHSAELTNMSLLTQRCCEEITIHGFYHQLQWERIDEYRVRPVGAKCDKCGKEWTAQFISRTDKARTPIETEVAELRERCKRAEAANEARLAEVEQIADLTRQRNELQRQANYWEGKYREAEASVKGGTDGT